MWHRIIQIYEWFEDMTDRHKFVRNFNKAGKKAFLNGIAPTILEAKISRGDSSFKHEFSNYFNSGFRIKALSGRPLSKSEMEEIKQVFTQNTNIIRQMVSLGWDTLEIQDNAGYNGIKCKLIDYAKIGGILTINNSDD